MFATLSHFPSPALPGSGRMGMISARCIKAPLMICDKGKGEKMAFTTPSKIFVKKEWTGGGIFGVFLQLCCINETLPFVLS
jgi:hypothetical protein